MSFQSVLLVLQHGIDWVTVEDYQKAKRDNTIRVISRFARGNVSFQNGYSMDEYDLERLAAAGNRAAKSLMRLASAN